MPSESTLFGNKGASVELGLWAIKESFVKICKMVAAQSGGREITICVGSRLRGEAF